MADETLTNESLTKSSLAGENMADGGQSGPPNLRSPSSSMPHFRAVRDGRSLPHFHQARGWAVETESGGETEAELWTAHARTLDRLTLSQRKVGSQWKIDIQRKTSHDAALNPLESRDTDNSRATNSSGTTLLDLKISLARHMLEACDLCPHHCRVNRKQGKTGFCGVADKTAVHWEGILSGEEIELMASQEVFLSGCTMRCAFCYSHAHITRPMSGLPMAPNEMAACVDRRHGEGASNLNLVGGEPIVHIPNILRMLREVAAPLPVVWNSNMYATPQAMALLEGVVDLFLGDIHFGSDECAQRLGLIPDYLPSVKAAFAMAVSSGADVIIRHLVMPGHLDCCARPVMEWAAQTLPETPFHLMFQYVPDFRAARDPVLGRFLTLAEIERAKAMAREIGVKLYDEMLYAEPLYAEQDAGVNRSVPSANGASAAEPKLGQAVDILIQGDGRVSFARLLPELLPVAAALDGRDRRVLARMALLEKNVSEKDVSRENH